MLYQRFLELLQTTATKTRRWETTPPPHARRDVQLPPKPPPADEGDNSEPLPRKHPPADGGVSSVQLPPKQQPADGGVSSVQLHPKHLPTDGGVSSVPLLPKPPPADGSVSSVQLHPKTSPASASREAIQEWLDAMVLCWSQMDSRNQTAKSGPEEDACGRGDCDRSRDAAQEACGHQVFLRAQRSRRMKRHDRHC